VHGNVPVGGIEDVPVAGGELAQERQYEVSQVAGQRHAAQRTPTQETVALGQVRLAEDDRLEQGGQLIRIHLVVAVHLDDQLGATLKGTAYAGRHRRRDTAIAFVADDLDAFVSPGNGSGDDVLLGAVVHHDDIVDKRRNAAQHCRKLICHIEAGDDDRDSLTVQHVGSTIPHRSRSAGRSIALSARSAAIIAAACLHLQRSPRMCQLLSQSG